MNSPSDSEVYDRTGPYAEIDKLIAERDALRVEFHDADQAAIARSEEIAQLRTQLHELREAAEAVCDNDAFPDDRMYVTLVDKQALAALRAVLAKGVEVNHPCRNCALFGRKAQATRGHACVDVDPCDTCGGARMLRVIEVFAQGGVTRERTCKQCSQKLREEAA